ncbi:hypothetical protein BaRGS_00000727 [Batillaria attramentaria]|uniref:Uncharacterized protein n=1 Tax=Batillaria attramentaria TaxID=370345 RepID=A0ABD0M8R6_9CAEN
MCGDNLAGNGALYTRFAGFIGVSREHDEVGSAPFRRRTVASLVFAARAQDGRGDVNIVQTAIRVGFRPSGSQSSGVLCAGQLHHQSSCNTG